MAHVALGRRLSRIDTSILQAKRELRRDPTKKDVRPC